MIKELAEKVVEHNLQRPTLIICSAFIGAVLFNSILAAIAGGLVGWMMVFDAFKKDK